MQDELTALRQEVEAIKRAIREQALLRGAYTDDPALRAAAEALVERLDRLERADASSN
jgi:hypothetical protein